MLLIAALLLAVYRSRRVLILGLLPVATGAMAGIAAVALGFGAVHGITLGFGITLIGESVDYSIYFFTQSPACTPSGTAPRPWRRQRWPIVRLGMLASVFGFASLLPSGFPGLAQLGAYSIAGLLAAAAVTRFVLPELMPARYRNSRYHGLGLAARALDETRAPHERCGALELGASQSPPRRRSCFTTNAMRCGIGSCRA